jgi:hypothetical protein
MASNDYFVIVYYILKYLYECMKEGVTPNEEVLNLSKYKVRLNDEYVKSIYKNIYKDAYIDGLEIISVPRLGSDESHEFIRDYKNITITSKGIEFLSENSMMAKAKEFIKDFGAILPW